MKSKIRPGIFLIFITVCVIFSGICGCAARKKYFSELKASYSYDEGSGVLKKFPSELVWEPNEFLAYENKKTKALEYQTLDITLPKRDYSTGNISDYKITMAYTLYNGKLLFTEVPIQYAPHNYFLLNNSEDSVIVTIDDENAFLINLNDTSGNTAKKLFNDDDIDNFFNKDAIKKLIYAKTISVSPDGRYLLYVSNRNYVNGSSPSSLDIYSYDIQTGAETKIMNFDNKEFLCWEKLDINPDASGNFLFRDVEISSGGKRIYSAIRRYSIPSSTESLFLTLEEEYNTYEMIDDQYIYIIRSSPRESGGKVYTGTVIYIADIYTKKMMTADAGKYSVIWNVQLSETHEYIAFFGSYINSQGIAIAEILTLHMETNNIVAHYEQIENNYFIDSFYWAPDNILLVNFQNTVDLYKDLCRMHEINHRYKTIFDGGSDDTPTDGSV